MLTDLSVNTVISVNRTEFSLWAETFTLQGGYAERRASADSDDGLPRAFGTLRASHHRGWPRRATACSTGPHLAAASGRYLRDLPHAPGVPRSNALPAPCG